jgi:membrane protein
MKSKPPVRNARIYDPRDVWRAFVYYSKGMYQYTDEHPIFLLAAGIAFNVLLCVVPLLFLLTYGLGYFIDWQPLLALAEKQIAQVVPSETYRATLMEVVRTQVDSIVNIGGVVGMLGSLGAVWTSTALFSSVRTAINGIYGFRSMRFFAMYKVYDVVLLGAMGVLVMILALLAPMTVISSEAVHRVFIPDVASWLDSVVPTIVSIAATFVLVFLVFRFLSHKPVPQRSAIIGAVHTTLGWEGARWAFSFYLTHFPTLGLLYGAYTFLVIGALWMYYSALVLILGGIIVRLHWERHGHHKREHSSLPL